jgi:hypothetical protein
MLNYLAKSLGFRFPSNFSFSAEWMKASAPTQAGRAGRTFLVVDDEAPILHCIRLIATIETAGRVTEVCEFSRLEDQIIILVSIPSISGRREQVTVLIGLYPPELSSCRFDTPLAGFQNILRSN